MLSMSFEILVLWLSCNFCCFFCSGYTMFKEEEVIWTTNRTAWKFPVAYPWSGDVGIGTIFLDPLNSVSNIVNNFIYFWIIWFWWMGFCCIDVAYVDVADDNARRCKSHNRNCRCLENWSSCNESNAESNVCSIYCCIKHICTFTRIFF